ncbi:MAG: glycosyltransferase family 39 protein [Planctomycetota bacterium]|jgi:4-amino-4-deoxy-L-arabinose transferase-like glycosyltransferase
MSDDPTTIDGAQPPVSPSALDKWWPWVGVAVLFVGLRLVLIGLTHAVPVDGVKYLSLGACWTSGAWREPLASEYHPLYPLLLGLFTAPFRDPELPARILSLLFSTLTLIPLYVLASPYGGRRGAYVALVLFALVPEPLRLSVQVLTEPLFLLCLLSAAALMMKALREGGLGWALGAGAAAGAAYLTRPEGLLLLLPFGAALIGASTKVPSLRRRILLGILCLAAFLLVSAPYMAWIGGITAKKSVTRLAGAGEYRPHEGPARPDVVAPSKKEALVPWTVVGAEPDRVAKSRPVRGAVWKGLHLFGKAGHFVTPFLLLFALVLNRVTRRARGPDLFLGSYYALGLGLVVALLIAYRYASLRHAVPATVVTLPLVAWGAMELWRLGGIWKPRLSRGFLVLWAAAFAVFFLCQGLRPLRIHRRYLKVVGAVLRARGTDADLLMSEDPRFAWYGRKRFLAMGIMDAATLEREARARGVRYLASRHATLRGRVRDFDASLERGAWRPVPLPDPPSGARYKPVLYEFAPRK